MHATVSSRWQFGLYIFANLLHLWCLLIVDETSLPSANACDNLPNIKLTGITQNIEVSEQSTIQNIEFSTTLQVAEERDIHKPGKTSWYEL